jgi:hypothetical protein
MAEFVDKMVRALEKNYMPSFPSRDLGVKTVAPNNPTTIRSAQIRPLDGMSMHSCPGQRLSPPSLCDI